MKIIVTWGQVAILAPKYSWLPASPPCVQHPVHSTTSAGKKSSPDWIWEEEYCCVARGSKFTQVKGQMEAYLLQPAALTVFEMSSLPEDALALGYLRLCHVYLNCFTAPGQAKQTGEWKSPLLKINTAKKNEKWRKPRPRSWSLRDNAPLREHVQSALACWHRVRADTCKTICFSASLYAPCEVWRGGWALLRSA